MIKPKRTVAAVMREIREFSDRPVHVKLNLGRNKYVTFTATISGIYPSIFTVEPTEKNFLGKTAYSYTEILCGKVRISSAEKRASSPS